MDWRKRSGRGNWRAVVSGARIAQMALDQRAQAEALVQLAREQQPSIGGHRGSSELDAKLGIEREANRARCRVTHWVVPSAPARSPREPRFLRVLHDYGLVRSSLKTKMRAKTPSEVLMRFWSERAQRTSHRPGSGSR